MKNPKQDPTTIEVVGTEIKIVNGREVVIKHKFIKHLDFTGKQTK